MTFTPRNAAEQAAWEAIQKPIEELHEILGSRGFAMFDEGRFLEEVTPAIVQNIVAMLIDVTCGRELTAALAHYLVAEFAHAPHACQAEDDLWRGQQMLARMVPAVIAPEEQAEEVPV